MKNYGGQMLNRRDFLKETSSAAAAAAFAAGIQPIAGVSAETTVPRAGWFDDIYCQLHLDAHFGGFREIYKRFDAEGAAQILDEAGFQMVSFFAKGWAGYSYYPTEIGVVHPGLDRDFTGEMTRALKKRGIRCLLYFMLQSERRIQQEHSEWVRNANPSVVKLDPKKIGTPAMMCINTRYADEVGIPQLKEILGRYDIDGFFLDIFMHQFQGDICYCPTCRAAFEKEIGGPIPVADTDSNAFAWRLLRNRQMEESMAKVQHALEEIKPDISNIYNWSWMFRYPVTPPEYAHHLSWDTPVPKVGLFSWNFSLEARYLATLPNITWSCMSTRGNTWGEYSLREPEAYMSENATVLAACGRTYLSDIPYPDGNPDPAVYDVYNAVNNRTRQYIPFTRNCDPVKDTVVLHSAYSVWSKKPLQPADTWYPGLAYYSVCGAHKAMIEGHVQIDISNSEQFVDTLDQYKAVVLADQAILNERECEAIRRFVKNGGVLLATGETATRDVKNNLLSSFAIADVLGVELAGISDTANCYLRFPLKEETFGIPMMDIQVMGRYAMVKPTTAQTLLELVPPYEGIKNGSPPPARETQGPGVTLNTYGKGKAIYCAAKLFSSYYTEDTPVLRKLALWLLNEVYPSDARTIFFEQTPSNVEVFLNQRGNERFIHLVNYSGDKRERGTPQVQDFTTVHGIRIHVKLSTRPVSLITVPDGGKVPYNYQNGWVTFEAEPLRIHDVYRIEV
ncbi:beta-galactosidase trimerization domain-containing protein [Candidatus Latescibacterota bacterium]